MKSTCQILVTFEHIENHRKSMKNREDVLAPSPSIFMCQGEKWQCFQKVMTSQEHQTIITLSFILNSKKTTKFAVKICNG